MCAAGYVCGYGSTTPTPPDGMCTPGTYSNAGETACWLCTAPPGNGCGEAAVSANGTECLEGQYGPGDWSPCLPCPAGFVCGSRGTTATSMSPCPYGFVCPAGTSVGTNVTCPVGFFCATGTGDGTAQSCTAAVPLSTWFDVDGDGDVDAVGATAQGSLLLLRNSSASLAGDCNVGAARGLPTTALAALHNVVHADVDGDGDDDVLGVTSSADVLLLRNNGSGFFVNATASSGLLVAASRAVSVTVGDVDGDGDVDVFVVATSASILMRNNGSGGFTDVTATSLLPDAAGAFLPSAMVDVDGDGDLDLFVPLATGNRLYMNNGSGTFVESGSSRGVATYAGVGVVRGAAAADVDGDGDVDVLVFGSSLKQLYRNNGTGWFVDVAAASGVPSASVNAAAASFGDLDNDGDVDVLMGVNGSLAAWSANNGSGGFVSMGTRLGTFASTQPVMIDVDGDGDVDIPALGLVNSVVPPGALGSRVATMRVLSRAGRRVCHSVAVVLRRSSDGVVVASRLVTAGAAPYDVHVVAPVGVDALDVQVVFPSGRRHSKATQAALSGVRFSTASSSSIPLTVVRDTPGIVSVRLSPTPALLGPGSTVTAVVRSLGDEPGLLASPSCTINGANVSSSLVDWRNGTYTFLYTVTASHSSVGVLPVSLQLMDARWGVASDAVLTAAGDVGVTVDTTPPLVSFNATSNCSPDNDTVTATVNQTLCVSCGPLSAEPFGCAIWLRVNASMPPVRMAASSVNNSVTLTLGPFVTGEKPVVVAWAEDTAGNIGPSSTLTWEVDLTSPVTVWTPFDPPPFTNRTSMLFSFGCSQTNCSFDYSFASSPRVRLGGNATSSGPSVALAAVETVLGSLPPRLSTVANATVSVSLVVNSVARAVNGSSGNSTVEVRLDAGEWTDVRTFGSAFRNATQQLLLGSLSDGDHALQARGRVSDDESDLSPWTHVWTVDRSGPNVSFWLAPPAASSTPQCSAAFVLAADEDVASFDVQWRAVNASGGDDGSVNASAWWRVARNALSLTGLVAGTPHVLHARATDRVGNVGAVASWRWFSGVCPSTASLAVALALQSFAVGNDSRAVMWSATSAVSVLPSEVQYRVNDGPWLRTRERPILVENLTATTQYRVDVRPAVPCGCEAVIAEQAWSSTSWFTYESGPGRVGIVSAPTLSSNSLYGDFELNSTARDAWFEYSLDGGPFAGCASRLRVGPLATGAHNVTVRSVDVNGTFLAGGQQTYAWTVVSLSSSLLALTDLRDGAQSVTVWAVKSISQERSPRTVRWVVDTVPPGMSAALVTPRTTNGATAVLRADCLSEAFPGRCQYCAVVSVNGGVGTRSCSSNGTVVVATAVDGVYDAGVTAVDAAGNEGAVQQFSWTRDTNAPNTTATVNRAATPLFGVPSLTVAATNTSRLVLDVSSSEASSGGGFIVTVDGVAMAANTSMGPTVVVDVTSDGLHVVVVSAVDAASNTDRTPVILRLLVDTTWPSTIVVASPPAMSNVSTVVMSWSASGESPGMLSRFVLSSTPSLSGMPAFVTPGDGDDALQASLTLVGVSSGAYTVTARAVDAVGHVDAVGVTFTFVVDVDAPTTRLVHSLTPFVNRSAVMVTVNASDALSTVTRWVRVDGGAWQAAASATAVLTLADGAHRIECRGVDAAGNVQPPPYDSVDVTVDTVRPSVGVAAVPPINSLSVVLVTVLVSDATLTRVYGVLDGSVDTAVSRVGGGVMSVGVATDGNHTLVLSSEDAAGNAGSVVSVSWYTDRVPPVTSATVVGGSRFVRDASASVSVACVNEAYPALCVACWQYAVVDDPGSTLTSTGGCESTSTLSFGYTFDGVASVDVFSVDAAGNVGGNASRVMWTWDRTPPDTTAAVDDGVWLPAAAAWFVRSDNVTLRLSSTESVLRFDVSVDGTAVSARVNASSSSLQLTLATGRHVVAVTAVDVAGNADTTPAAVDIVMDGTAPPPPRFTLLHERGCFVLPSSPVYVCNSSDAVAFDAACSEVDGNDTAPCFVEWRLDAVSVSGSGGCAVDSSDNASATGSWSRAVTPVVMPKPPRDGQYRVWWRASDGAGNVGTAASMLLWLDSTPPAKEPSFTVTPGATTFATTARFELKVTGDTSPGRLSFVYELTRGVVVEPLATAALPEPTNDDAVQLLVGDMQPDESYSLRVWTQDQAGHRSAKTALHTWVVASVAPTVAIASRPSPISALVQPVFVFSAMWGNGTSRQGVVRDASFLVSLVGVSSPHSPCDERGAAPNCSSWCNGTRCEYSPSLDAPASYTLQVQAVLGGRAGDVVSVLWEYRRCSDDQFAVITDGDAIVCKPCPAGGDCTPSSPSDVVTQADIVARAGYWASPSSDGSRFYRCPILGSCVGGVNGSRAVCARGYGHVACSLCADGYFEQFGLCVACPKSSGTSIGALLGLSMLLLAICAVLYMVRSLLPIDVIKLGVSMVQIIASANSAYDIPWPSAFRRFLSLLRVFLLDVVAITQASCAQPMDYYASMMVVCVGLKLALALLLLGPWVWSKLSACNCFCARAIREAQIRRHVTSVEAAMAAERKRQGSVARAMAAALASAQVSVTRINWSGVFKASFMLLFIAYPGVSLKVLRLFRCREIEGEWWLAADMRLRCYDGRWAGYALYGLAIAVVYVVGLPAAVLSILWRRRHKLFGSPSDPFAVATRATFGFLYEDYGVSAWWWEAEELLRKLLLSAVVVLIDEGSPLQVTLAVLVSGWAHVLHAMYKPWGVGSVLYRLQHGALFVTSFVFLMGLLFKVDGVSSATGTYSALSDIMVLLCAAFLAAWVAVIVARSVSMWRGLRAHVRDATAVRSGAAAQHASAAEVQGGGGGSASASAAKVTSVARAEHSARSGGDTRSVAVSPAMASSAASGDDGRFQRVTCRGSGSVDAHGGRDRDDKAVAADCGPEFVVVNPMWRGARSSRDA
jgi:hypothetical protein